MYQSRVLLRCARLPLSPTTNPLLYRTPFLVRNHGIPQSCLDKVLTAVQTYFSLPMATKMKVRFLSCHRSRSRIPVLSWFITKLYHKAVGNFKGYSPPLDLNVDAANNDKGDFHEGFIIRGEEIQAKAYDEERVNDGAMAGANVWPMDDHPNFREACLEY